MDVRIPSISTQYVWMDIASTDPALESKLVSMAVMPRGFEPEAGDFKTAAWIAGAGRCQVLVGPGSAVGALAEGPYKLWTKVTATPEVPVLESTNCLVIT